MTPLKTLFSFLDANTTPSREKDDLRSTIRHLEEKLRAANRAEKPLEETGNISENEKALKTTEELARSVFPNFLVTGAVGENHFAENVLDDQPGVVYFVQLSGAKCTWEPVKTLFLAVFKIFCWFYMF